MKHTKAFIVLVAIAVASAALIKCLAESAQLQFAIHFQEGFTGQLVRVTFDTNDVRELYPKTNPLIGLAGIVISTAATDRVQFTVAIPSASYTTNYVADPAHGLYFGISDPAWSGSYEIRQSANAFGYD